MTRWARAMVCGLLLLSGCVKSIPYEIASEYNAHDPRFVQTMCNLFGPSLLRGNRVTTLVNGDQIFPAMLEAIAGAKRSIDLETYIYTKGEAATAFTDALVERARAGVSIHIVIDAIGSGGVDRRDVERLSEAGVEVRLYHKLHWWQLYTAHKLNYRTHRKLMVVDGRVGFIGGVGIDDRWRGDGRGPREWRDNHYRVEGPIVGQLQSAFIDNWVKLTGRVLHGDDYFPPLNPAGEAPAQVLKSSTGDGSESVHLMFLMSLAAARDRVCLVTPYFVPDVRTTRDVVRAAARGVRVQVIVPGPQTDSELARQASRADWGPLLKAGVEIYEYQPTMIHVKLMIVDDLWVSIGSANFDNRSFRLNDECNLNVLDADFAAAQTRLFEADLARCERVTYERWQHRPLWNKFLDGMSTLLSPQL